MYSKNDIVSRLTQSFMVDGHRMNVRVVKHEGDELWSVEVVNDIGTLTAWNDMFQTDKGALDFVLEQFNPKGAADFVG